MSENENAGQSESDAARAAADAAWIEAEQARNRALIEQAWGEGR